MARPSYSSFNQLNYIRFLIEIGAVDPNNEIESRWARGLEYNPLLFPFGSIKYGISKTPNPEMVTFGFEPLSTFEDVGLYQNKHFLPLGFTYDKYVLYEDFQKLSQLQKEMALYRAVVTEEAIPSLQAVNLSNVPSYSVKSFNDIRNSMNEYARRYQDFNNKISQHTGSESEKQELIAKRQSNYDQYSAFANLRNQLVSERNGLLPALKAQTLNITSHSHKKIEGSINLPKSKMLFFSIPFDSGWKAEVDGKEVQPLMVNVGFTGIPLEAGEHTIQLKYKVPYLGIGLTVSLISLLIYLGLFAYGRFLGKKANSDA